MADIKRYLCFVLALAVFVAVIGVACDGGETSAYEALLASIPDTPETRDYVYIDDYALVRQIFPTSTFPLPGPGDNEDAVAAFNDWLSSPSADESGIVVASAVSHEGFGRGVFGVFNPYRGAMVGHSQYLAFDVRNIDQSIRISTGPFGDVYDVVRGRFAPQAADVALSACSECPEHNREEHRGVLYYSWGEDYATSFSKQFAPPAFDEHGRGGRIAVLDEYVFRTLGTSEMKALIDAHLKEGPSLADVEEFRLLAGGMSQLTAYTMFLSDGVERWGLPNYVKGLSWQVSTEQDISLEDVERKLAEAGPWLRPYQAFGVGAGKDEEGRYMALVLVHADGDSAEENVGLLHRIIEEGSSVGYKIPWSDLIDINSLEINAEGRLLLSKIRGRIAASPLDWVSYLDNLILHE